MTTNHQYEVIGRLTALGISTDHAAALRRIAMTLQRWFELECGDSNNYGSWAIERDDNGDGPPFMVHHHYLHGQGKAYTTRTRIPDRETGACKRLTRIMSHYPELTSYVQTDPRGAALFIGKDLTDMNYNSRGVAVYK